MALLYTPATLEKMTMPQFSLQTVDGKSWKSSLIEDCPAKIIIFMCNHCPYVKAIEDRIIKLAKYFSTKNVPVIGICSNDPSDYPEDSPEELLNRWRLKNYSFTYLVDTTQEVAKKFDAVCTPDFFAFDKNNYLVYRGRLDDSWRAPEKVTREELKLAVDAVLSGKSAPKNPSPSMGCSIKWREA
jgi:peroxiredoxin